MDKYEFKLRSEEIDKLMENQKYADAVRLADTIDWKRVKSTTTLCKIAELYKINRRFDDCYEILGLAYDRNPNNRNVVYALCEICLETGDIVEAIEYFKEFANMAPRDAGVYTLRYRIYEAQNVGYEERIELLEEFKKKHLVEEEWEYELAYLYHRAGFATKCVEACDEMIIRYGNGPYVIKAMELKMLHEPLTPDQQEKYDMRNEEKIQIAAQAAKERNTGEMDLDDDFRVKTIDMSKFNTMNLQAELAENLKEYINDEPEPIQAAGMNRDSQQVYHNTIPADAQEVFFADQTADMRFQIPSPQNAAEATPEMEAFKENFAKDYVGSEPPQSMGMLIEDYDEGTQEIPVDAVVSVVPEAPVMNGDTSRVQTRNVQEIHFEDENAVTEEIPGQQSFITNTQKIPPVAGSTGAYERLLAQEMDGQISLANLQEEKVVEKQITGQLNIQDIIADWEKMKKEREQKMQEEVRQKVLQQTGQIFTQFDVDSKTGILASLEDPSVLDQMAEPVSETVMKGLENHAKQVIIPFTQSEDVAEAVEESVEAVTEETPVTEELTEELAEAVTEEIPVVEELTEELSEAVAEEVPVVEELTEELIETAAEEIPETEATIVSQFTGELSTTAGAMDTVIIAESVVADIENAAVMAESETAEDVVEVEEEVVEVVAEACEENTFASTGEGNFYGSVTEAIPGGIWKEVDGITEEEPADIQEETAVEEYNMQEQDDVTSEDEQEITGHKDLTDEEKDLFKPFLYSKKMKAQILDTLEKITLAAYVGNVVITADAHETSLKLAKLIVSYVRMCDDNFSGNVAKIDAEKLNTKDMSNVFAKLVNGALLVENAGKLNSQAMRSLLQELNQEATGIIVILMDKKRAMDTLMGRGAVISEFFNARIDILSMNVDMLVNYGMRYVNEKGYSVDDMGRLALYKRVSEMQAGNHTVTIAEVKELMDDAMYRADRGGLSKMASIIMRKRYDENDMIIIKEKDFN
ncbi:MAG: hypothetical protein IJZ42_10285 [Lachnospiraceae bacterium]|nr:hypothetical protein [Lachnospiraceae bacterium]